ncbi:replication protein P [Pseudomonas sp. P8_241]|uniref:replication protein P n=1 Tax=Pseudomonas sp. P8_241 TaxID=3043445 RepID=UPI002A3709FE|nr:replication protein P [Pseudomonas sp. P8_241]WPN45111.1 replication protein P [Pseudomonas sp. P8_241]
MSSTPFFRQLQAIFPAWKQPAQTDAALNTVRRSWTKAFIVEGISQLEQIRFGIERR